MKKIYILGILAFLVLAVGSASAQDFLIDVNKDHVQIPYNHSTGINYTVNPDSNFTCKATYVGNKVIVNLTTYGGDQPWIHQIYLCNNPDVNCISAVTILPVINKPKGWDINNNTNPNAGAAQFGNGWNIDLINKDNGDIKPAKYPAIQLYEFTFDGTVNPASTTKGGQSSEGNYTIKIQFDNFGNDAWLAAKCPPNPQLSLAKKVSPDNNSWVDDSITVLDGSNVYYQFTITNTGNVDLTNPTVTDPILGLSETFTITLAPGHQVIYYAGPITAKDGKHENTATANATYQGTTCSGTDNATYIGTINPLPQLSLAKKVSPDNNSWVDDSITVPDGSNVYYQFTITNTGNVDLTNPTVTDPILGLSVTFPITLAPGHQVIYYAGPITAKVGTHENTATANATYQGTTYSGTDDATYIGEEKPTPVPEFPTIVLPVAAILGLMLILGRRKKV